MSLREVWERKGGFTVGRTRFLPDTGIFFIYKFFFDQPGPCLDTKPPDGCGTLSTRGFLSARVQRIVARATSRCAFRTSEGSRLSLSIIFRLSSPRFPIRSTQRDGTGLKFGNIG